MTDSQQESTFFPTAFSHFSVLTSEHFSSSVEKILLSLENEDSQQHSSPPQTPTLSRLLAATENVQFSPYKPPKSITLDEFLKLVGITFLQVSIRKPSRCSIVDMSKSVEKMVLTCARDSPLLAFYCFVFHQFQNLIMTII
jgi:hypothetical protein